MKMKLKLIVHPKASVLKYEFELQSEDLTKLNEDLLVTELAFEIEKALNEHVKGLRAHISLEE